MFVVFPNFLPTQTVKLQVINLQGWRYQPDGRGRALAGAWGLTRAWSTSPPRQVKEKYARGIVTLFPYLSDPFSKDMAMSIILMARVALGTWPGGLKLFRNALLKTDDHHLESQPKDHLVKTCLEDQLDCNKAISLMKHSADEDTVKKKMKLTFVRRRNIVLDPQQSSNILSECPSPLSLREGGPMSSLRAVPHGYRPGHQVLAPEPHPQAWLQGRAPVEQDFVLMFGEGASGKLLKRWPCIFKKKSSNNAESFHPHVTPTGS
ncbi:hypothetical protein N1851_002373 [Merluccius polli]|uniref:Uncharacterized protein n=1 Tax=Merluccius polli TaxID=89951 RepID=A0AA47NBS7_MERPO|nr:hypothetical protein N1851_002373 [Merluccius polli]